MAKQQAYGGIAIIDVSDVGKLSAWLGSSLPLTTVYDPNKSPAYFPNWETNNLVLTPFVELNGEMMALSSNGLSFVWERQAGSGNPTALVTGEKVSGGVLTVSKNVLADADLITYICTITYRDPDAEDVEVKAKAQMTFGLIKNVKKLSKCDITGETAFKYNGEGNLISAPSIILTATLENTTVKQWQYKKADGSFEVYPNSSNTTTLTVNDTDDVFVGDMAVIKLVTNTENLSDIHQIWKVRNGAAGSATITCNLTNDSQSIPTKANGELYPTSLNGANTKFTILKGSKDDTANWNITATTSDGITGTFNSKTFVYTVTGITVETGYVDFIATRPGYTILNKRFTVHKDRSGADAADPIFYYINSDLSYLKIDKNDVFVPETVTFSATKRVGNNPDTAYSGRFKIYESTDGENFDLKYTSGADENSHIYRPSSNKIKLIKGELYEAGTTTNYKDSQSIPIVKDGIDGEQGDSGADALSIRLGNFSDNINCDTDETVSEAKEITIPFKCELGMKATDGTAVVATPLPSGITVKSNTPATTSSEGCIILSVAKGATLFSGLSGEITITITSNGLYNTFKFSINKIIQAKSGENAVLLEVYVTGDSTINNGNNNVILRTILHDGMDTATTGVTYQWSKYIDGSYQDINGCTNDYLTVTPHMVDSTASFRCRAVYKTRTYQAFYTVMDKTDPISVECFSSLGDKLVNGSGVGGVYAMVFQNGQQIDEIKSTDFLTEEPSDGTIGYFYKVNTTSKSVTLMKYSTSDKRWVEATGDDLPSGTYEWYRRNKNGESLDTVKPYKTGKAIYLDNSIVNKKISFVCKYTAYTEEDTHVYILTDEVQRPVVDESDNSISTIVYE